MYGKNSVKSTKTFPFCLACGKFGTFEVTTCSKKVCLPRGKFNNSGLPRGMSLKIIMLKIVPRQDTILYRKHIGCKSIHHFPQNLKNSVSNLSSPLRNTLKELKNKAQPTSTTDCQVSTGKEAPSLVNDSPIIEKAFV